MVKHAQTVCRQQPTNCLSGFDHFVGLALKGLKWFSKFNSVVVMTQNKIFVFLKFEKKLQGKLDSVTYYLLYLKPKDIQFRSLFTFGKYGYKEFQTSIWFPFLFRSKMFKM